jgi:magnesium-protoporphyrin IX monomethyl ester (oxidative) cyclase
VLGQAEGAIDAVVRGEGEVGATELLARVPDGAAAEAPGAVTLDGSGPAPRLLDSIDRPLPARDLLTRRHRYFIGVLDPAASVELTRGCPWDCSFCSAWTFYGRSYRRMSPEAGGVHRRRRRLHQARPR